MTWTGPKSARKAARALPARPTLGDLDAVVDQLISLQLKLDELDHRRIRELVERVLAVLDDATIVSLAGEVPGGYTRPVHPHTGQLTLRAVAWEVVREAVVERHAHRLTA